MNFLYGRKLINVLNVFNPSALTFRRETNPSVDSGKETRSSREILLVCFPSRSFFSNENGHPFITDSLSPNLTQQNRLLKEYIYVYVHN